MRLPHRSVRLLGTLLYAAAAISTVIAQPADDSSATVARTPADSSAGIDAGWVEIGVSSMPTMTRSDIATMLSISLASRHRLFQLRWNNYGQASRRSGFFGGSTTVTPTEAYDRIEFLYGYSLVFSGLRMSAAIGVGYSWSRYHTGLIESKCSGGGLFLGADCIERYSTGELSSFGLPVRVEVLKSLWPAFLGLTVGGELFVGNRVEASLSAAVTFGSY